MITSVTRAALVGALACATTVGGALTANAAEPGPRSTDHLLRTTTSGSAPFTRVATDGASTTAGPSQPSTAAAGAAISELPSACPAGQVLGTVYSAEDFSQGLPYAPDPAGTWTEQSYSSGGTTNVTALSSFAVDASKAQTGFLQTNGDPVPTSGPLYVAFRYRGDSADGVRSVDVNGYGATLTAAADWTPVFLDVTQTENSIDQGVLYAGFGHDLASTATTPSTFEVDDVHVYTCVNAPNAGVRGDWTGEGTVDLLGTTTSGDLYLYPGKGDGRVGSGVQIGSGWGAFTWQGSPGDVTGDRRTDLVARAADGSMRLYAGRGAGAFATGVTVGTSWGAMTALATPGDMTLDGLPELVARRSDGTLHLYSFATTGAMRYVKQIGTGWNGMAWIIGMGDLNGDHRGDVVGVNVNGCLYAYNTTASATLGSARKVGCGWAAMNWLTSPGDMNHDGYGDLVARSSDGSLWFYRGKPGGGVYSGVKVGSGWQGMARIL